MMKPDASRGFGMCFLLNLLLHMGWGIASLILLMLHFFLNVPWFLSYICAAVWLFEALAMTILVCWGNRCAKYQLPHQQNRNPYSSSTKDVLPPVGPKEEKQAESSAAACEQEKSP